MSRCVLSRPEAQGFPHTKRKWPKVLVFDTSGPFIAIGTTTESYSSAHVVDMQRGQAEALFPLIEEVLEAAGWRWDMLDAIGVGVGPGNFTGIRISVAAARGLRLSLGVPVFGFSTFHVAANDEAGPDRLLLSLPAPRDMAYVQVFDGLVARGDPRHIDPSAPPGDLAADRVVGFRGAGIGAALGIPGADEVFPPKPAVLAELTEEAYLTADADPPRPAPLYIRPPDAAPSRVVAPVILP